MSDDPIYIDRVLVAAVAAGSGIYTQDAIEYDGKLWLVPQWIDRPDLGFSRPQRLIRVDHLRHSRAQGLHDLVVHEPVPKPLLDDLTATDSRFEIRDLPPILVRMKHGQH